MNNDMTDLSLQEMAIIMLEYGIDGPQTIIGRDADIFRSSLQKDIELCKKHGGYMDIPDEVPWEYSMAKVRKLLDKERLAPLIYFMRSIYTADYSIEKILPKDKNSINLLESRIDSVLSQLSDREKKIIELYYGFENSNFKSYCEISRILGISEQYVHQIHENCITKLNQPDVKDKLKAYFHKSIDELTLEIQKIRNENHEDLNGEISEE